MTTDCRYTGIEAPSSHGIDVLRFETIQLRSKFPGWKTENYRENSCFENCLNKVTRRYYVFIEIGGKV